MLQRKLTYIGSLVGNDLLYPPRKSEGNSGRISCCHESTSSKTSTAVAVHVEYIADVYYIFRYNIQHIL